MIGLRYMLLSILSSDWRVGKKDRIIEEEVTVRVKVTIGG